MEIYNSNNTTKTGLKKINHIAVVKIKIGVLKKAQNFILSLF